MKINIAVKKKGMTLIEALLAISIFTMGIAGFSLLFVKSWGINSYTYEMGQSSMAVYQGVSSMGVYLREVRQGDNGSYPIKSASDNDLVVYSDFDKDGITERLHFYKNGNQIIMGYRKPSGGFPKTYADGDQETRVMANSIVNEANVPIFYYYNKNYPGDQANNPVPTPANVANIRLVKIYLKINIDPNRAPDNIETSSFIELRNLNDY